MTNHRSRHRGRVQRWVFLAAQAVRRARGFTLVELMTGLAIVGLLMAIAIPAVQQTRTTAQRTECVTRIGQIMLASLNFEQANGFVPTISSGGDSTYWALLPYLDESALGQVLIQSVKTGGASPLPTSFGDSTFCCPADSLLNADRGGFSFHQNNGTKFAWSESSNGYMSPFPGRTERRLRDITDGLSHTTAFGERLYDAPDNLRDLQSFQSPKFRILGFTPNVVMSSDRELALAEVCRSARVEPVFSHVPHSTIMLRPNSFWGYDHLLPPNAGGCVNGPEAGFVLTEGLVPTTSLHAGGVNVAFADGHADFESESIDVHVWRAIGTVAGND